MKFLCEITVASVLLFSTTSCASGLKNARTETVKISGNCGMCETTIENAGNKKKEATIDWNRDTKLAVLVYDSIKTSRDAILKRVALAGYDNQSFRAKDEVYTSLPGCCHYEREMMSEYPKNMEIGEQSIMTMNETVGLKAGNVPTENQLYPIYENYFSLKDALVSTNGKAASANAKSMQDKLKAVTMETLGKEEHMVWMNVKEVLLLNAEKISESKDPELQRNYFDALSNGVYKLMKASDYETSVYYQFCPMAMDGKGANWLSKEKEIKNPYYGTKMLSCGTTVETIEK